jgi:ribosomal protein L18E
MKKPVVRNRKKLTVKAHRFSAKAKEAIEANGGQAVSL